MCYYNGCRVSRAEFIRLKEIEKEIRNLHLNRSLGNGFNYGNWPIIKPIDNGKDIEIKEAHWEYIPDIVYDEYDLKEKRKYYTWLNAKAENLFTNERGQRSLWEEGALYGRCLVLSSGFFEYRHLPKIGKKGQELKATEAFPYFISLKDQEYFFMAGISRVWTNKKRNQSADTFAIITTEANSPMAQIHNKKLRMPTILTEDLAWEWIQPGLSKQRILEIASFQFPADKMEWYTVSRDFRTSEDPYIKFDYPGLPIIAA